MVEPSRSEVVEQLEQCAVGVVRAQSGVVTQAVPCPEVEQRVEDLEASSPGIVGQAVGQMAGELVDVVLVPPRAVNTATCYHPVGALSGFRLASPPLRSTQRSATDP